MKETNKRYLILFFMVSSMVGFMIKLPFIFNHYDKELHALFYLCATMTILILYPRRIFSVPASLGIFGIIIEITQEFSNKISKRIIGKAIHGRFDIEDVKYNLLGIFLGVFVFLICRILIKSNK